MNRVEILRSIDEITAQHCKGCNRISEELKQRQASQYCLKECDIGAKLQELGQQLSGETLARKSGKQKPQPKPQESKTEEATEMNLTKEQYLSERATGKNRNKICMEHGINPASLYHWLKKWGIKETDAEERVLEEYIASNRPTTSPVTTTAKSAVEPDKPVTETAAPEHSVPRVDAEPDKPVTMSPELPAVVVGPFDAIEWFELAAPPVNGPKVSVNKNGLALDGAAATKMGLREGDLLQIGVVGKRVVLRTSTRGLPVKHSGKTGARVQSRQLESWPRWSAIVKRKYELKQAAGAYYIEVEVNG